MTFYRKRDHEILPYFGSDEDKKFTFCKNVEGLLYHMGLPRYFPNEWRLFIDSSKSGLKCVLLHNGNEHGSVPIGYSTVLKEKYDAIEFVLRQIKYEQHQWPICVDLKMVSILLGQQLGYTKFPCYLCKWDSRADSQHWTGKQWPTRDTLVPGQHNVIKPLLVTPDNSDAILILSMFLTSST